MVIRLHMASCYFACKKVVKSYRTVDVMKLKISPILWKILVHTTRFFTDLYFLDLDNSVIIKGLMISRQRFWNST